MLIVHTIKVVLRHILPISVAFVLLVVGTSCFKSGPGVSVEEVGDGIFELVNEIRSASGLAILDRSSQLDNLASEYVDNQLSDEWEQSSDIRYLLSNSWNVTYSGKTPSLTSDTAEAQVSYCLEQPDMKDAMYRLEARETGIGIAIIGDTVYYTQVFDVVNLMGGDGQPIRLSENPDAEDPSWEQLKEFLEQDDTDEIIYTPGAFICGDFAETLHNNAEEAGIRAAYVAVYFADGPGHALNAFSIGDETVFVDVIKGDKVAYIEVGELYGVIALDVVTDFSYSYFETYAQSVEEYFQELEAYNEEVADYNNPHQPVPPEYDSRQEWQTYLNNWYEELEAEAETLGISGQYWDPTGSLEGVSDPTVVSVYVHW